MTDDKVRANDLRAQSHFYEGALRFSLELFGDQLAKREGYQELAGIDAVRYYLMLKFRWLPREVKALSFDDLRFAMAEEISGWTTPPEAQNSFPSNNSD